ncbi:glycosyl hydrolase [Patescibacteria group bacterium]|nr:glycosyl hydrolase [Patescibacteria group bacterium]
MRNLIYGHDVLDQDVGTWLTEYSNRESKKTRLVITLSALGIILFLTSALFLPFKDRLFNLLYPKPSSQATFCSGNSTIPAEKQGFVYTGGDLSQEIEVLNTPLYYTYDTSLGSGKKVYMVGKYASNYADPLGLHLLMGDNLSNTEFKGLGGQNPTGWTSLTAGGSGNANIETAKDNILNSQTSVKINNRKSPSGTQIVQTFKEKVNEGDIVVFGAWVKTQTPEAVKLFLQADKTPFTQFGQITTPIQAQKWNYVLGYGKVPASVTNFQMVIRVAAQESTAWFDQPTAVVINGKPSKELSKLVLERCGSAWFVGNEPGAESSLDPYIMEPVSPEIYALIYHQFYQAIKEVDPQALVLPAGIGGGKGSFTPKAFLDAWRTAYKGFFNVEPPLDGLNIHYLATDVARWSNASDLEKYLGEMRAYMESMPLWKGKPIWISELGVGNNAPNGGVSFMKASLKFLENNNLNVAKWFWLDTCGFNPALTSLFNSNNKICAIPAKLTLLGESYVLPKPTPTATPSVAPTLSATPSAQVTPTPSAGSGSPTSAPTVLPTPASTASYNSVYTNVASSSSLLKTPEPTQSQASSSAQ